MSDKNQTENDNWRLQSLEEEDDIIELTEEIEPVSKPVSSAQPPQNPSDEIVLDLDDTTALEPDAEVHELRQAADDSGLDEIDIAEENEEPVFDLGDEAVMEPDDEVHELRQAADDSGIEEKAPFKEAEEQIFEFEEETSSEPYEQIEELSVSDMEEIGMEEVQPEDIAEEFGATDIETEVDIAEVADLEPIQADKPPEEPQATDPGDVLQLREELKADPEAVIQLQEELTPEPVDPVLSGSEDIIEITDFDQQYFSDEEAQSATSGLSAVDSADEADFLELIDVEDADDDSVKLDDEIIHLGHDETEANAVGMEDIMSDPDQGELPVKTPVPGFFESSAINAADETKHATPADPAGGFESEEIDENGASAIPAAVSAAQIEAAVANIIERDYAGKIESMVAAAIEKVVSQEIERIKSSLFGEEEN